MASNTIFLKGDDTIINLDGYETTIGDLKDRVIDSELYRRHLKELRGDTE